MTEPVAKTSEIPVGERKHVFVDGKEVVVFNVDGEYHAVANYCPHMGGPVANGPLTEEDSKTILSCPFHSWRFDVDTGEAIFPGKKRIKKYDVTLDKYEVSVEDEMIHVHV